MNKPHRSLEVWKHAMALAEEAYGLTGNLPAEERYGLTSQMRRSAVSVPSNIAEGMARRGSRETIQFLQVAIGSLSELGTQLDLCRRLGFLSVPEWEKTDTHLTEVDRMLAGLRNHSARKAAGTKSVKQ